jgi:hypothetical protein
VKDAHGRVNLAQTALKLNLTAWIGGDDDIGAAGGGVLNFARAQTTRHGRLGEVVDARAPAAERGFVHLQQLQTGNALEQLARSLADALGMNKVTWLLVGHTQRQGPHRAGCRLLAEEFADIAHAGAELRGPFGKGGIVAQQMGVLFERSPTAGGVNDNKGQAGALEGRDVAPGQTPCALQIAGMDGQGAAAPLARWQFD